MSTNFSNNIPNFIKAKSEKRLRFLMFKLNIRDGVRYDFFDIQFVKGNWYAWFYQKVTEQNLDELSE